MPALPPPFAADPAEVYIIAEAGVNHDGSVADAHALIELAARCGADAVKFQTFEPAALVSATARTADYQAATTGVARQLDLLERYMLPAQAWPELRAHATELGIEFLSTAFDLASLDLVCSLGVRALKFGSGELTNRPLLVEAAARGLPVIASTGMGTEDEVGTALEWLAAAPAVTLLHCVSSYPAPVEQSNLHAIGTLRRRFGRPVGWSDHTLGAVTAVAAVALGAVAVEKHVTLDRSRPGPDHAASADEAGFADYVAQVRAARAALGDGVKRPVPAEAATAPLVRRSWHAARDLAAGTTLTAGDLVLLRPATGLAPAVEPSGRTLARPVRAGAPVQPDDLLEPAP
jgi:N-acetylneuraminate synthase/N,N'-diacetyllegionaminate synthase